MKFSDRYGITELRKIVQVDSINQPLKNALWDQVYFLFSEHLYDSKYSSVLVDFWTEYQLLPFDEIPVYWDNGIRCLDENVIRANIRSWFFTKAEWFEIYNFIELLMSYHEDGKDSINLVLGKHLSAYRIVDDKVTKLTSENEIASIEESIVNTETNKLKTVNLHLKAALTLFSDLTNPQYRNSMKESISAVESICQIITGKENATLGEALGVLEKNMKLHGALKASFSSLYGYTNQSRGIRHAIGFGDDTEPDFDDAKLMLVMCTTFINYLIAKIKI